VLVTVLIGKFLWELFFWTIARLRRHGGRVLAEAHLLGAIGGILVWLLEQLNRGGGQFDERGF